MNLKPWRPAADTAEDRTALQAFTCTTGRPPMGAPHPRPWELEVQGDIRQRLLRNTTRNRHLDQRFQIAEDDIGIAAVFAHARMSEVPDDLAIPAEVPMRMLLYGAVALRHRGTGLADTMMTEALYDVLDREPAAALLGVLAKVDHRNSASERMCERHGFGLIRPGTVHNPYGLWGRTLTR